MIVFNYTIKINNISIVHKKYTLIVIINEESTIRKK